MSRFPGTSLGDLPGPLPFTKIIAVAARLCARRPLALAGAFAVLFVIAFSVGALIDAFGVLPSNVTIVVYELIVGVGGAFAVGYLSLLLAETVTDDRQEPRSTRAIVRAHARELVNAGLLSTLFIITFTMFGLGPLTMAVVGPPLIAQAIVLEYRPFRDALRHVRTLAAGRWARLCLILLGTALAMLIAQVLLWIAVTRPLVDADDGTVRVVLTVFGYVVRVLSAAFLCSLSFVLYLDLRARAEELTDEDFLEERRNATGVPAPAGSSRD